ncbi:MAG: hypothetical protein ACRD5Z_26855, partial [Bryobacteraceae bacterium]
MGFRYGALHPDRLQVFVASFTEEENKLSQWRGYSYGSGGISLAFRLDGARTLTRFAVSVTQFGSFHSRQLG